MKTILFSSLILISAFALAQEPGLSIPNAHIIYDDGQSQIIRGKAPTNQKQIQELIDFGVSDFLIFKIDTKGEVAKEIQTLLKKGIRQESITHLAFPWKDVRDFTEACTMTLQALQVMQAAVQNGRNLYLHCTAGEDRTGYLAGLFGLWAGTYSDEVEALKEELCARGYEAGNPGKPYRDVVEKIRETLTPTYLKMAKILIEAKEAGRPLDTSACDREPTVKVQPKLHYCSSSLR